MTISGHGGSSSFFAYNVDNQTTWALPAPTGTPASQLMIVGTKIFNFQMLLGAPVNIGQVFSTENGTWYTVPSLPTTAIFETPLEVWSPTDNSFSSGRILLLTIMAAALQEETVQNTGFTIPTTTQLGHWANFAPPWCT